MKHLKRFIAKYEIKKTVIKSLISAFVFVIVIIAVLIPFTLIKPSSEAYIGIIAAFIGISVAIVIGFQIYNAIDLRNGIKKSIDAFRNEMSDKSRLIDEKTSDFDKISIELKCLKIELNLWKNNFERDMFYNSPLYTDEQNKIEVKSTMIDFGITYIYNICKLREMEALLKNDSDKENRLDGVEIEIRDIGELLNEIFILQENKQSIVLSIPTDFHILEEIDNPNVATLLFYLQKILDFYMDEKVVKSAIDSIMNIITTNETVKNKGMEIDSAKFIEAYASILKNRNNEISYKR